MKTYQLILAFSILALLYSCSPSSKENNLLTIDVTKNYPKIKLKLEDIADIKYVKLKDHPDYLVDSRVLSFGEKYIIVRGENEELLIFDHKGDLTNRIKRVGNGPHEYLYASNLYLDEEKKELLVHDSLLHKFFVYSLDGDFIREGKTGDENYIYSFNEEEFICHNKVTDKVYSDMIPYFSLISKEDWLVKKEIRLPIDEIRDIIVEKEIPGGTFNYSPMHYPLIRCLEGFALNDVASDTIYKYSYDGNLFPFIVRKPSIKSMRSPVYLRFGVETGKYIFLTLTAIDEENDDEMFPSVELVYDKEKKTIHEYQVLFEDWPEMPIIFDAEMINRTNIDRYGCVTFNTMSLVEYYRANRLKGKLRDIVANMDEEDNSVVMMLRFK